MKLFRASIRASWITITRLALTAIILAFSFFGLSTMAYAETGALTESSKTSFEQIAPTLPHSLQAQLSPEDERSQMGIEPAPRGIAGMKKCRNGTWVSIVSPCP